MKTNLIIFLFIISSWTYGQAKFDIGFKAGYKAGYCYKQGIGCIEPILPTPPIPSIYESSNNYQDGYNRGFELGLKKRANRASENTERFKVARAKYVDDIVYNPYKNIHSAVELAKKLRKAKGYALEHLEKGNYNQAIKISLSGVQASPKDDEFMLILGQSYKELKEYGNAIKWYKKAARYGNYGATIYSVIRELERKQRVSYKAPVTTSSSTTTFKPYITYFNNPVFKPPLREEPSITSKEIARCPKDAKVIVLEETNSLYYKVEVKGFKGYVSAALLR